MVLLSYCCPICRLTVASDLTNFAGEVCRGKSDNIGIIILDSILLYSVLSLI